MIPQVAIENHYFFFHFVLFCDVSGILNSYVYGSFLRTGRGPSATQQFTTLSPTHGYDVTTHLYVVNVYYIRTYTFNFIITIMLLLLFLLLYHHHRLLMRFLILLNISNTIKCDMIYPSSNIIIHT